MNITGTIVSGLGEGARYVALYSRALEQALGWRPWPGTLNVRVAEPPQLTYPITIAAPSPALFPVQCTQAVCMGMEAAIVRPRKTAHGADVLEVLSPVHLKMRFNLNDGDRVAVCTTAEKQCRP